MRTLILMLCLVALPITALAGETKTVTLAVDGMTCNMCPITVKKALRKVPGVSEVTAKYEGDGVGWARVSFDPARVKVEDLTRATEQAGYPSRLRP